MMESTAFILMFEFQKANQFCEVKVFLNDRLVSKERWNPSDILVWKEQTSDASEISFSEKKKILAIV